MRIRIWAGLVLGCLLLSGATAQADFITYEPVGTFTGGVTPGTPIFTSFNDPNTMVSFIAGVSTVDATPTSGTQAGFGSFTTTSDSTTPVALSGDFTLLIYNLATDDTITFHGTLGGTLTSSSGTGFIQFAGPLTQNLDGFTFTIESSDEGSAGRVDLGSPGSTTGMTTVGGNISITSTVPEPSTLALLGLGSPVLLALVARRRLKAAQA
jgi:PEP-CTERM motif